jgi:hypothetical protein
MAVGRSSQFFNISFIHFIQCLNLPHAHIRAMVVVIIILAR